MLNLSNFSGVIKGFFECAKEFIRQAPTRAWKSLLKTSEKNESILWKMVSNLYKRYVICKSRAALTPEDEEQIQELDKAFEKLEKQIK